MTKQGKTTQRKVSKGHAALDKTISSEGRYRPSISLTAQIATWAKEMATEDGFDNFSAFISDLIRHEKRRRDERALQIEVQNQTRSPEEKKAARAIQALLNQPEKI